jgi:ABC-type anion transport system duplicated permease subunit
LTLELIFTLITDTLASWIRIFVALALSIVVAWIVGITAARNMALRNSVS